MDVLKYEITASGLTFAGKFLRPQVSSFITFLLFRQGSQGFEFKSGTQRSRCQTNECIRPQSKARDETNMDVELNDLHQLSSSVFTSITGITPHIRNLVASAKAFHKSYQGTILLGTQFIQSLDALAESALSTKGATQFVGQTLKEIMNVFCEIEYMKQDLMKVFLNEVIVPLESRAEQEINMSKLAHKQYLQDNKIQTELVNKTTQDLVKVRKKSQRRKAKPGKYEKKEEEMLEGLQNSEKKLRTLREQGLRRALIGERRIYCFVADRICTFGRGLAVNSNRIASMLNQKMADWDLVVSHPSELPSESEQVITNPSSYNTATMRRKDIKQTPAGANKYHTMDARITTSSSRPSVIGKEAMDDLHSEEIPPQADDDQKVNNNSLREEEIGRQDEKQTGESNVGNSTPLQSDKLVNGGTRMATLVKSVDQKVKPIGKDFKLKLRALYDHKAKDESQLSFSKHDILNPISAATAGWQYGENMRTGRSGWFPAAYVEVYSDVVPSPKLPLFHGNESEKNSESPKEEKVRRVSMPATSPAPFIPERDYDIDDVDFGPKNVVTVSSRNNSTGSRTFQHSVSTPTILEGEPHKGILRTNSNPLSLMPLSDALNNVEATPAGNKVPPPVTDFVAMPFPPPPPDFEIEDTDQTQVDAENPFASVRLKKTVTNDRSMPLLSTSK